MTDEQQASVTAENPITPRDASTIKFSVITVVRDGMPFVEQAINSVINQDYPNLEYIVIDGASTDGTVDIITSNSTRIAKWISEKDEGIADAFNKGLSLASGDYILILNSDDALSHSHVLSDVSREIANAGFPELIYGDFNALDRESGQQVGTGSVQLTHTGILYGQVLPHPCLFTHRKYFEIYGNFDKGFKIAMDYEWLLRGILKVRVVHMRRITTNIRAGGISTRHRERVVEEIISALKTNGYFASRWQELRTRAYFYLRGQARNILVALKLYHRLKPGNK